MIKTPMINDPTLHPFSAQDNQMDLNRWARMDEQMNAAIQAINPNEPELVPRPITPENEIRRSSRKPLFNYRYLK